LTIEEGIPIKAGWGFNTSTISFKFQKIVNMICFNFKTTHEVLVTFYDIGGDLKFRKIWSNYYADIYGCVYVVNCQKKSRINESRNALHEMYKHELMNGKPLLMYYIFNQIGEWI
jgi:signal recognition particle receptor subunit beta